MLPGPLHSSKTRQGGSIEIDTEINIGILDDVHCVLHCPPPPLHPPVQDEAGGAMKHCTIHLTLGQNGRKLGYKK